VSGARLAALPGDLTGGMGPLKCGPAANPLENVRRRCWHGDCVDTVMAKTAKTYTVLIVDDHEPTRLLVGRILSQELGVRVVLAGTCEQALHLASETVYDVIVLDLLMPGIGGFGVLKQLRMESANRATPAVVLSVMADEASMLRCKVLGANTFVAKPVDRERVAEAVGELLPASSARIHASSWQHLEKHL
jgi:CheY-like chemotaxis protein